MFLVYWKNPSTGRLTLSSIHRSEIEAEEYIRTDSVGGTFVVLHRGREWFTLRQ